jgi:hypothetical protein
MDVTIQQMKDRLKHLLEQHGVTPGALPLYLGPRQYHPLGEGAPAYALDEVVQDLIAVRLAGKDVCEVVAARHPTYRGEGKRALGLFQRLLIHAILSGDPNVLPAAHKYDISKVLEPNEFLEGLDESKFLSLYEKCVNELDLEAGLLREFVSDEGRAVSSRCADKKLDENDEDPTDAGTKSDQQEADDPVDTGAVLSIPAYVVQALCRREPNRRRGTLQTTYEEIIEHLEFRKANEILRELSQPTSQHCLAALRVKLAQAQLWKHGHCWGLQQAWQALEALEREDGPLGPNAAREAVNCLIAAGFSPETSRLQAGSWIFLFGEARTAKERHALRAFPRERAEGRRVNSWIDPADFEFVWADPSVTEESLREAGWHLTKQWQAIVRQHCWLGEAA